MTPEQQDQLAAEFAALTVKLADTEGQLKQCAEQCESLKADHIYLREQLAIRDGQIERIQRVVTRVTRLLEKL